MKALFVLNRLLSAVLILGCFTAYASALVVLDEDFEDGSADDFTVWSGDWGVVNGKYHCHVEGFDVQATSVAGSEAWFDYEFCCRVTASGGVNKIVMFRVVSADDYYYINARSEPFNDIWFHKVRDGVMINLNRVDFPTQNGVWYEFVINAVGNYFDVSVDGEQVFSFMDFGPAHMAGGIGLVAYAGGAIPKQDIRFDDVRVTLYTTGLADGSWSDLKSLY